MRLIKTITIPFVQIISKIIETATDLLCIWEKYQHIYCQNDCLKHYLKWKHTNVSLLFRIHNIRFPASLHFRQGQAQRFPSII